MIEVKSGAKSKINHYASSSSGMANNVNEADVNIAMNSNYFNDESS